MGRVLKKLKGDKYKIINLMDAGSYYYKTDITVIESQSLGTPVLGANIGGIPELISDQTGMTFTSGDVDDLKDKIRRMFEHDFDYLCETKRQHLVYAPRPSRLNGFHF